jgi:hypothetical protein
MDSFLTTIFTTQPLNKKDNNQRNHPQYYWG